MTSFLLPMSSLTASFAPETPFGRRVYRLTFVVGVVVFVGLALAGIAYSLLFDHRPPDLSTNYLTRHFLALAEQEDHAALSAELRITAEIDPQPQMLENLARAAARANDQESLHFALTRLIESGMATDAGSYLALATLLLRQPDRKVGDATRAVSYLQESLRLEPDQAVANSNLGTALLLVGKPDQAAAAFRRALELDPGLESATTGLDLATGTTAP